VKKIPFPIVLLTMLLVGAVFLRAQQPAGRPYVRYAQFLEDTKVTLTDGSEWAMDKGDCFPIDMFKDQQTKVVLKLGSATFTTDRSRVRVMDEKENDAGCEATG
jgi:ferric-dicitrate binding protein FerR (iron transport regulator)